VHHNSSIISFSLEIYLALARVQDVTYYHIFPSSKGLCQSALELWQLGVVRLIAIASRSACTARELRAAFSLTAVYFEAAS
jgi:hypothetical protein